MTGYPDDILELIANVRTAFSGAKTIEEAEQAWTHFYRVSGYVESSWSNDRAIMEALKQVERGLSTFTRQMREGALSPYSGWGVSLFTLQRLVGPRFDKDGYPVR